VPTLSEAGIKGYEYMSWMGVAAPAGTPQAVISRLHMELGRALRTPAAQEWYAAQGSDVVGDSPAEFAAVIRAEFERWGPIVREARIKVE
jgi:tripartite-type tricarboxylate transporter receptor subunit TctC